MKEQEFKTVLALGAVDYVCCDYNCDLNGRCLGWSLWIYGDNKNEASCLEINRLGNRMMTARGDIRVWKSLDNLVEWLIRTGVRLSDIRLDSSTTSEPKKYIQTDWTK